MERNRIVSFKLTMSLVNCFLIVEYYLSGRSTVSLGDTESITSDIAPLPNPPLYMPYSGNGRN